MLKLKVLFPHPTDAFDFDLMVQTLSKLKEGRRVEVPVYDFGTHCRAKYTVSLVTQVLNTLLVWSRRFSIHCWSGHTGSQ